MNKKLWEASPGIKNNSNLFRYEKFLEKNYKYKPSKKFKELPMAQQRWYSMYNS